MIDPVKLAVATVIVIPAVLIGSIFYDLPEINRKADPAVTLVQPKYQERPPFDTVEWVPDEAMKKRALLRAYLLNGNSMVGRAAIDVSDDPVVTGVIPAEEEEDRINYLQRKWERLFGDKFDPSPDESGEVKPAPTKNKVHQHQNRN
jgi:hypothetical protein